MTANGLVTYSYNAFTFEVLQFAKIDRKRCFNRLIETFFSRMKEIIYTSTYYCLFIPWFKVNVAADNRI